MFKHFINLFLCLLCGYAECVLANRAQGFLGFIGLAKETVWGTAVGATDYIEAFSENLVLTKDRFPLKNMFAVYAEPDDAVGLDRVAGDIVCAGYPRALGRMFKGVMNSTTGTTVLSGFLYTTRFISTQSEFSAVAPSQPYTFEVFRDVTSSHQYAGCVVQRLQLSAAPNEPLNLTASVIGKSAAMIAKTTPTFVGSPLAPFTFDTCSVSVGGTATARMESFRVTVDNMMEPIPALNASAQIARIRRRDSQSVTVEGVYDFTDFTEYNDFVNQTERAMKFTFTKANSFQFSIEMPRVVYTAFPTPVSGRERLTVAFAGKARYLTSSTLAVDFSLTDTNSTYA
mgnify:CR=1 FL=1